MSTLPTPGPDSVYTIGAMVSRIQGKLNEPSRSIPAIYDAANDAIMSIWMAIITATLSKLIGGPVNQVVPAGVSSVGLVSIPDPVAAPTVVVVAGGALASRTVYFGYVYVTDSGSTTLVSPLLPLTIAAAHLGKVSPPPQVADAIGWYPLASADSGGLSLGIQDVALPLDFNTFWTEPVTGAEFSPDAPFPPTANTTGDNIFAIKRLDAINTNQTFTSWIQTNIGGQLFSQMGNAIPNVATSWTPCAYDLIDNRKIQLRPAPGYDVSTQYFYVVKPRRLRFPMSLLPFTSVEYQRFAIFQACADLALDKYEYEYADRLRAVAKEERQAIIIQVATANWDKDNRIVPFSAW